MERKTKVIYDVFDTLFLNGVSHTAESRTEGDDLDYLGFDNDGHARFHLSHSKFGNILYTVPLDFMVNLCNINFEDIRPHLLNYFKLTFPYMIKEGDYYWITM